MSRKRRQRSTAIRKRIEKKQREEQKRRKKSAKAAGNERDELVRMQIAFATGRAVGKAIQGLAERLGAEGIRGWTVHDLEGRPGLAWLGSYLVDLPEEGPQLELDLPDDARRALLDKLGAMEIAAPGLGLDWDADGFPQLIQALGQATEIEEEEEEEEEFDWSDPAAALREEQGEEDDEEGDGEEGDGEEGDGEA